MIIALLAHEHCQLWKLFSCCRGRGGGTTQGTSHGTSDLGPVFSGVTAPCKANPLSRSTSFVSFRRSSIAISVSLRLHPPCLSTHLIPVLLSFSTSSAISTPPAYRQRESRTNCNTKTKPISQLIQLGPSTALSARGVYIGSHGNPDRQGTYLPPSLSPLKELD